MVVQTRAFILVAGSVLRAVVFMKLWSALGVLHHVYVVIVLQNNDNMLVGRFHTIACPIICVVGLLQMSCEPNYYRLLLN